MIRLDGHEIAQEQMEYFIEQLLSFFNEEQ
jgi:hypothetical protein